jgi:lipid-binding SYLF domain-containing protein
MKSPVTPILYDWIRIAALAAALLTASAVADAQTEQQDLLTRAHATIATAQHDPQFGDARSLFTRARAVMVVPELVKGGFIAGAEGGNGVLLTPTASGAWGNPLFYTLGGVSFGLQIGLEESEVVLFVMSDKALRAWTQDKFSLGAQAGLTVLVIGSSAQASATANANVDIIAWAKSKGAYAGITLEGSGINSRREWNTAFYGHPVSPAEVLKINN